MLAILKPSHIEKLFRNLPIGDQALFEHKLELWKQTRLSSITSYKPELIKPISSREITNQITNHKPKTSPLRDDVVENRTKAIIVPQISVAPIQAAPAFCKTDDHLKHYVPSDSAASTSTSSASKPIPVPPVTYQQKHPGMILVSVRYNLRTILEETSGGQMIMSYYEKHKILREEHRTALINVIARYIDANGHGLSLAESNQIEEQIVELFPTEKCEFYRTNRRGRIYNKVANMKRVYKKFSMAPEAPSTPSLDNSLTSAPSSPTPSDGISKRN